jgi:hypothetical protein
MTFDEKFREEFTIKKTNRDIVGKVDQFCCFVSELRENLCPKCNEKAKKLRLKYYE